MSGVIPLGFYSLEKIKSINLSFNFFSGEIPIELLLKENLESLYLQVNNFEGFLSEEFCNRVHGIKLLLYGNSICGPYPHCIKYIGKQKCDN